MDDLQRANSSEPLRERRQFETHARTILYRFEHGLARTDDIDLLWDVQRRIEGNTICPFGDAAAWPVAAAIRHFRDEFEYHATHPTKVKDPKHFEKEPMKRVERSYAG